MKSYLTYFILKFKMGLQYRAAAIAGVLTQVFFGLVYTSVYIAFYESNTNNGPMELGKLVSFVWLNQAFFSLIYLWHRDKEIINMIKKGDIAYELCRPQDLYFMWASKMLGERIAKVSLRFIPVLLLSSLLPFPYTLDLRISIPVFIMFLITLILASLLVITIVVFYHTIIIYTLDEKGIVNMFMILADVLSGLVIPIPFFPGYLQKIAYILPFRYVSDFPFRLYVGDISITEGFIGIGMQIIWIIILFVIGKLIMKKALSKAVIQGG